MKSLLEFETLDGIRYIGDLNDLIIYTEIPNYSYTVKCKGYERDNLLNYPVDFKNAIKILRYIGGHDNDD